MLNLYDTLCTTLYISSTGLVFFWLWNYLFICILTFVNYVLCKIAMTLNYTISKSLKFYFLLKYEGLFDSSIFFSQIFANILLSWTNYFIFFILKFKYPKILESTSGVYCLCWLFTVAYFPTFEILIVQLSRQTFICRKSEGFVEDVSSQREFFCFILVLQYALKPYSLSINKYLKFIVSLDFPDRLGVLNTCEDYEFQ